MEKYNPKEIEQKWQKKWADEETYKTEADASLKKYYVLEMFPYPFVNDIHKLCDVRFVKRIIHGFQILKRQHLKDVTVASCGKPLTVADCPPNPVFP